MPPRLVLRPHPSPPAPEPRVAVARRPVPTPSVPAAPRRVLAPPGNPRPAGGGDIIDPCPRRARAPRSRRSACRAAEPLV